MAVNAERHAVVLRDLLEGGAEALSDPEERTSSSAATRLIAVSHPRVS